MDWLISSIEWVKSFGKVFAYIVTALMSLVFMSFIIETLFLMKRKEHQALISNLKVLPIITICMIGIGTLMIGLNFK